MQANQPTSAGRWPRRRRLVGLAVASLALLTIVAAAVLRSSENSDSASTTVVDDITQTEPPSTAANTRERVISRLHQIFQIRDRALESRDASLLEGIYTSDCPCLSGDRELIERLRRDHLIWRGIDVRLEIQEAERLNDRLWTVNAIVNTGPFQVMKESGEVINSVPEGKELSRFLLANIGEGQGWLLGRASRVEERD